MQGKFSARLVAIPIATRSLLDRAQLHSVECVQSLRSGGRHTAWDRLVSYASGSAEHLQPLMPRQAFGARCLGVRDVDEHTEARYSSDKVTLRRKIWQDEQSRRGSGCKLCLTFGADRKKKKPYPRHACLASTRSGVWIHPPISSDTFLGLALGYVRGLSLIIPLGAATAFSPAYTDPLFFFFYVS